MRKLKRRLKEELVRELNSKSLIADCKDSNGVTYFFPQGVSIGDAIQRGDGFAINLSNLDDYGKE